MFAVQTVRKKSERADDTVGRYATWAEKNEEVRVQNTEDL